MGTYDCVSCGEPFIATPPDDVHIISSVNKVSSDNAVTINKCKRCDHGNTLFWKRWNE